MHFIDCRVKICTIKKKSSQLKPNLQCLLPTNEFKLREPLDFLKTSTLLLLSHWPVKVTTPCTARWRPLLSSWIKVGNTGYQRTQLWLYWTNVVDVSALPPVVKDLKLVDISPRGLWRARGSSAETHSSLLEDGAVVNNNKDNSDMLDAPSQQEEKPAGSQAARWRDTSRSSVPVSVEKKQHSIHQPIAAGFDQLTLFFSLSSKKKKRSIQV